MEKKELRSGYTTGTHTAAAFMALLELYTRKRCPKSVIVTLPKKSNQANAQIIVTQDGDLRVKTIKVDNDDMDVTKGCEICVELFETKIEQNHLIAHEPSIIQVHLGEFHIYAGKGVGVSTKKGLNAPVGFPAINPTPLSMMKEAAEWILDADFDQKLFVRVSVKDGEIIAKETANAKVGVLGGISILGSSGIVKPISAEAYIDSIATEVSVVNASECDTIIFTLGNTAYLYALENYDETAVIEVGNFLYDASKLLKESNLKHFVFISSIGKMTKVAQRFKNTHNRFGTINFELIKGWLNEELEIDLGDEEFTTVKAIVQTLEAQKVDLFIEMMTLKAAQCFQVWFEELGIKIRSIKALTLEKNAVYTKEVVW
jgi:cobalt-precorrin-5B (C1)-methyltransferase